VEYNTDPDVHMSLKHEVDVVKTTVRKKGGAGRAQNAAAAAVVAPSSPAAESSADAPRSRGEEAAPRDSPPPANADAPLALAEDAKAPPSPASSTSSASESPLAMRVQYNGNNRPPPPPAAAGPPASPIHEANPHRPGPAPGRVMTSPMSMPWVSFGFASLLPSYLSLS
jgi:SWI/SNF-related matrix-associated actin-dependent regulator of chromatin subfamily B protein 1